MTRAGWTAGKALSAAYVSLAIVVGGCSGSNGGVATGGELIGLFTASNAGGGNPYEPSVPVFRDQVLLLSFAGTVDATPFGGFVQGAGGPRVFIGRTPGLLSLPYYAFADQAAARNAIVVTKNVANGQQISYLLGVPVGDPKSIVVDPRVDPAYGFALASSGGFRVDVGAATTEYVFQIPADSALRIGGRRPTAAGLPLGTALPAVLQPGGAGTPAFGFGVVDAYVADPTPPEVVSITAESGATGAPGDPIPATDRFLVRFTRRVTSASIGFQSNFRVRNLDVLFGGAPVSIQGSIVPYDVYTGLPCDPLAAGAGSDAYCFLPSPDFGPGVSAVEGYDIEVRVGSFGDGTIGPIRGEASVGFGLGAPLTGGLAATFRTAACPTCAPVAHSIIESFGDGQKLDAAFVGQFGQARWASVLAPGVLTGRSISGSASGTDAAGLGTRVQFSIDPLPLTTTPSGLFSPFDASLATNAACGTNCGGGGCNLGVNPAGGSHIMHLFEGVEFAQTRDALELIEWAPVAGTTLATTYPSMSIWCGLTGLNAPMSGTVPPSPSAPGLSSAYGANYSALATGGSGSPLIPFQSTDPSVFEVIPAIQGGNGTAGRVRVFGAASYPVAANIGTFYPYPVFTTPFDFAPIPSTSGGGNLILEMNIEPGSQCANFHRFRSTAAIPVRRLIGVPLSQVAAGATAIAANGGFDIYKTRFTFVGRRSSARSLWYDTGSASPIYAGFQLTPSPAPGVVGGQPAGTQSIWTLDGFSGVGPPVPTTLPTLSGVVVDAAGMVQSNLLTGLTVAQCRFFRFRADFLANTATNAVPSFDTLQVVFQ